MQEIYFNFMFESMIENNSDIEVEDFSNTSINIPFNPDEINIKIIPRNIGQLVELLDDNQILIPKYQRRANLWNDVKKSRFIESLMLDLPIPLFYFDERNDRKWYVVDGLQRMSTIEHFILGSGEIGKNKTKLQLQNLEFLTQYNDKFWDDLPKDIQRRINSNQVTVNLIGKGTPDEVKYTIFSRINQGSTVLKAQEIRTALFQGFRIEFLEKLINKENEYGALFHKITNNSIKSIRQEDLDFISRFIAFYNVNYEEYEPDMDNFITKGTKLIPENEIKQNEIIKNFKKGLTLCFDIFGTDSFRKRTNLEDGRKPINKPIFEVLLTTFAKLEDDKINYLRLNAESFRLKFIEFQKTKTKFWNAITTGTATKDSVNNRHSEFVDFLKKFLNDK